ncbi:hypothetical protein ACB092_11G252000 [Castanea dentata]
MAQKTGKEETEFKVHEKIPLCINNCGFTGNPATNNMCQNCFNTSNSPTTTTTTNTNASSSTTTTTTTATNASSTTMTVTTTVSSSSSSANKLLKVHHRSNRVRSEGFRFGFGSEVKREVNRCFGCRRKVGLTGFRCRCGELFCAEHRYTDRHVCSYDYKAAGREAIARENPVVTAAKIVRV